MSEVNSQKQTLADITNVEHVKRVGPKNKASKVGIKKRSEQIKNKSGPSPMENYLQMKNDMGLSDMGKKKGVVIENEDSLLSIVKKKVSQSPVGTSSVSKPLIISENENNSSLLEDPGEQLTNSPINVDLSENVTMMDDIEVDSVLESDDMGMHI